MSYATVKKRLTLVAMARDLTQLIHRSPQRSAASPRAVAVTRCSGILDSQVAQRLGKAPPRRTAWISERDALDAAMTFALTFTGAMVFLL